MALDPNIALGVRPIEIANPLAQYGQIAQIQNAQNQNALAQYQLSSAQRSDEQQNKLYLAAQQPNFKLDFQSAIQYGAPGLAAYKAQQEAAGLALTQTKTQGEIDAQKVKAAMERVDAFSTALAPLVSSVQANKPITHSEVFAQANRLVSQGLLRKEDLANIPMNVAELPKFVMGMATSTENSRKALQTYLPEALVAGGNVINKNPLAAGGIGNVLGRVSMTDAQIEQNKIAQQQANTAAQQASLAERKFAFEKANPGYELKENENGDFFGVNKRTLQAFPVTIGGGAAPAAAPMVPNAGGMPGPRMAQPGAVVPAIPGMTSVLDQNMPAAAPTAGGPRQLVGKGTAMTEHQSKSAMFGAAMNQANGIISKVEKDGTTTAPVAVSVLQGLAKLSPQFLGSGENAANAIESIFRQDPTSLLGPDVNQQKLGQAQIAFATAYLRATSGASFGPSEVSNTIKEYFPLVGEDKTVVKQKAEARQRAIEGMKISTNKQGQNYIDKSGANADDPLGLRK